MTKGIRPLAAAVAVAALCRHGRQRAGEPTASTRPRCRTRSRSATTGPPASARHLRALQEIADRPGNDGTRSTGDPGSRGLGGVRRGAAQAGGYWNVTTQPFTHRCSPSSRRRRSSANPAAGPAWVANTDFATMESRARGTVDDAPDRGDRLRRPTTTASASSAGCEDTDFPAGATPLAGKVAVIQRGTCDFGLKAQTRRSTAPPA